MYTENDFEKNLHENVNEYSVLCSDMFMHKLGPARRRRRMNNSIYMTGIRSENINENPKQFTFFKFLLLLKLNWF